MMDDATFMSVLKDSNVLDVKDHLKWNWNIISELLDGTFFNFFYLFIFFYNYFIYFIIDRIINW